MIDHPDSPTSSSDDMSEYLQMFLDETEEQLDDLVETLLLLERDPESGSDLNEAFRLVHSIKGSAGMMGLESIAVLTHHLETRFERLRSGTERLDAAAMNLVLRCVDFLRDCTRQLRSGQPLGSSAELMAELTAQQSVPDAEPTPPAEAAVQDMPTTKAAESSGADVRAPRTVETSPLPALGEGESYVRVNILFDAGLPLVDLKARLIVARLSSMGDLKSTSPNLDDDETLQDLTQFSIVIETDRGADELRTAVDVDGVAEITMESGTQQVLPATAEPLAAVRADEGAPAEAEPAVEIETPPPEMISAPEAALTATQDAEVSVTSDDDATSTALPSRSSTTSAAKPTRKLAETMRVDIDRLDNLMNLAGELVVNRARFVQVSGELSPTLGKSAIASRLRDFRETLRRTIDKMQLRSDDSGLNAEIQELESGLGVLAEQMQVWDHGSRCFAQITEAIDQLSRVSDSLQRGVLGTRMVPVAPLFNRFRRVVRDLSLDRGKKVNLLIRGEKTELDKRMIDELGDPLVHLVRNSIDHGLEPPAVRTARGKREVGTIYLEASHSGNNVFIHVRDDGGGIDAQKIKQRLIDKNLVPSETVNELSDQQLVDYIWHPGFSTAEQVTDVSGRGVGMDVVKTRIADLNGSIEVESQPGEGTAFHLRLPLTLAIINSLLVRIHDVSFAIPIDDIREIVSIRQSQIVSVHGKRTFAVRGEYLPLIALSDVLDWHEVDYGHLNSGTHNPGHTASEAVDILVLQTNSHTMGLCVDELLGSEDIVIKSLSDNFVDIRGLSGASILGDGSVSLMLDVGQLIEMALPATTA